MDFQHLEAFINIAKFKNLTKASKEMHCVQSSLSHKLKQLEDELETNLFLRKKYGMELTESGAKFLSYAENLLELRKEAKSELNLNSKSQKAFTLGFQESFFRSSFASELELSKLKNSYQFSFQFAFADTLLERLRNTEIDYAVIAARKAPKEFKTIKKFEDEIVLVLPKDIKSISEIDINSTKPLHLGESCFFARFLQYFLEEQGLYINLSVKNFSLETITLLISQGFGFSILPKSFIANHSLYNELNIIELKKRSKFQYYLLKNKFAKIGIYEKEGFNISF